MRTIFARLLSVSTGKPDMVPWRRTLCDWRKFAIFRTWDYLLIVSWDKVTQTTAAFHMAG
jgi:hypothetical protein